MPYEKHQILKHKAIRRIIAAHPELQALLDNLEQQHARMLGISMDEYRDYNITMFIRSLAEEYQVSYWEIIMLYAANSHDELVGIYEEDYQQLAKSIGIDYDSFYDR
ncbi:DUF6388 family protein [Dongshaea marina]|uniref:DUF6388 family protein n=1 Tax=Dongshaea marina TaxID=2047966 RepID=UPI000D3E492F|nr:DUF6388 family protein [Dongshaea marina]